MKYTIWRISPDGTSIQILTAGETSVLERALEKARIYNERLKSGEPEAEDRFAVLDENGEEVGSEPAPETEPTAVRKKGKSKVSSADGENQEETE